MQLVYRRKLSVTGVVMIVAAKVRMLAYRAWRSVWLVYLWLRHRHDGVKDDWLTKEDLYCSEYFSDPEVSQILDEYIDFVAEGLAGVLTGQISPDDAIPPEFHKVCMRLERAIAEHIWQEDCTLDRTMIADWRWVYEEARERAGEITSRMFDFPPSLDFDSLNWTVNEILLS